ncbi:MAG: glycosyltransferase family 4 protein [Chloroflexi bacterium]|nr:glycosyltransferase family 4 protein [Chloroflexota bacterium]
MRVLVVHNHYRQPGGEQVAVEAQVGLLQEAGHSVILYAKDNRVIEQYDLGQRIAFLLRTVFSWEAYREIKVLVAQNRPDVAHVHNVFPLISPSVYRALKHAGVPIIQTVHNFRFLCPNGLLYTQGHLCERCKYGDTLHALRWRCYRNSYLLSALYAVTIRLHRRWGTFQMIDHFIAPTEFTAAKLVESGLTTRDKISVLPHFLPDPLPTPGSFEQRDPHVIYLGRLSPEKGIEILVEAMTGLPSLRLKLLGDGPLTAAIRDQVQHQQLSNVELLGYVSGEAKWEALRHALATVVPSVWYEVFGFAVLESLAVGTSVVASNLGGIPHVVEDRRSGLLFRPRDSANLREKLAWLVEHPKEALAMGQYGRYVVQQRYTATTHYAALLEIYRHILERAEVQ